MLKKILALSSIRSDYDLLSDLYFRLNEDPQIDFRILASGAHLSRSYGLTINCIKRDGFRILSEIESLIDGDTLSSRLKTASVFLQGAVDCVANWQPDIIIYAGDREDVMIGAMLGVYLQIPSIHFYGGDHEKDGHSDTQIRHATSKLSTAHIVTIEQHKERLLAMGESEDRIFVSGNCALDKFVAFQSVRNDFPISFPTNKSLDGYALVIFHPVDDEVEEAAKQFENILLELRKRNIPGCVSYPNTDPGNHAIVETIEQYSETSDFWFYKNLERKEFLSLYHGARFLVGNSSSGILEAASIPLGVVNVGTRQQGRYCSENVIFCGASSEEIGLALDKCISEEFQRLLHDVTNPYGDGSASERAYQYLINTDFESMRMKIEDPLELKRIR